MTYYYHATTIDNFKSILCAGKLKTGIDGIVYLTKAAEDAIKFVVLRVGSDPIIVIKLRVPDESLVEETFDHSYNFFKCKSYGYPENIDVENIIDVYRYD